jgi:hypothetical protein
MTPKAVATAVTAVRDCDPSTEELLSWDAVVDRIETVYKEFLVSYSEVPV